MDARDELTEKRKAQIKLAMNLHEDCMHTILRVVFPDVKTGDFPPDATFDWEQARETFFARWLYWNAPEMQDDSAPPDEELPHDLQLEIEAERKDIRFMDFDNAYYEDATKEWVIPCQTKLCPDGIPESYDTYHGNMRCELVEGAWSHYVGDWTLGPHPDITEFDR